MDITFTTAGALIGLALSIFLIIKKIQPAYSLIIGALIGGLIGSGDLVGTVEVMITGAQGMMSSVIRILTSGILAGALIKTGAAIASQTFSGVLLKEGIPAIFAGAMVHTGATVLDSLPHGSFFHATGGSVDMNIKNRMRLIPYEALIGLTSTILSIIWYLIFR